MISQKDVERQLKRVGCNFTFWGRPEINELSKIIMEDETIAQCVNGQYDGGFALLCVTDHRILLIDKKPMYLTIDDMRYDMISDVSYNHRLLDASLRIMTSGNKTLYFRAYNQHRLRFIMHYTQQRITEARRKQDRAEQRVAEVMEHVIKQDEQPSQQWQPQPTYFAQQIAQEPTDSGFRRHMAMQMARLIGPRAVAFSQFPPALSRYKLPLLRRPT